MGFFRNLFEKAVTARDLKVALIRVDRDRKRKQLEVRKLSSKQGEIIEKVKKARREGNNLEVDYMWEELNGIKLDLTFLRREARVLNLEGIALKKYIRGLERLEKSNNRDGIKGLLDRTRKSGLDAKLAGQFIDEQGYLDELTAIMEEIGLEAETLEMMEDDPAKAKFLAEIDAINEAEEAGDYDAAVEKEEELKADLEKEAEEGPEAIAG
jgi:hypothetical protein